MTADQIAATEGAANREAATETREGPPEAANSGLPVVRDHEIGGKTVQAVLARDLHRSLGLSTQYGDWFKEQVVGAKLVEGTDFVDGVFQPKLRNRPRRPSEEGPDRHLRGRQRIGMMSQTPGGDRVRAYFSDCEFRLMNGLGLPETARTPPAATATKP